MDDVPSNLAKNRTDNCRVVHRHQTTPTQMLDKNLYRKLNSTIILEIKNGPLLIIVGIGNVLIFSHTSITTVFGNIFRSYIHPSLHLIIS